MLITSNLERVNFIYLFIHIYINFHLFIYLFIYVLEVMDHVFSRCFKYQENVLNIVKKKERKNINLIFSVFQISKHRLKEFQYMRHILLYLGHGNDF